MKRRLIAAIVFLLLGAILNVAIAWACAVRPTITFVSNWSVIVPVRDDPRLAAWLNVRSAMGHSDGPVGPVHLHEVQGFGHRRTYLSEGDQIWVPGDYVFEEAGWPMTALNGGYAPDWNGASSSSRADGVIALPIGQGAAPIRPAWPGFAVDTLVYAAMLWLLFAAPGMLRRRRRIARGLCPACAYPVGASDVCTECGRPVRSWPSSSPPRIA